MPCRYRLYQIIYRYSTINKLDVFMVRLIGWTAFIGGISGQELEHCVGTQSATFRLDGYGKFAF